MIFDPQEAERLAVRLRSLAGGPNETWGVSPLLNDTAAMLRFAVERVRELEAQVSWLDPEQRNMAGAVWKIWTLEATSALNRLAAAEKVVEAARNILTVWSDDDLAQALQEYDRGQ